MKKIRNTIIFLIIFSYVISIVNLSFAVVNPSGYMPDIAPNVNTSTVNMMNKIIGAFQAIGSIVSVLALILIGIKYMMGSVEEKAEYKQTMIAYIIGAILVFGISNISAILYDFFAVNATW